ncbi:MAG: ABC transporter ATP-binding protein [Coprococcus sp.]
MVVNNIVKNFMDVNALKGVSFEFEAPSFVGVIGHNGSGKTTLLEIMMGLQRPTSGEIDYSKEFDIKSMNENIGVILQTNAFYNNMKVIELLKLFKSYYKDTFELDYLMNLLKISEYKDKYYDKLSGGMRQKVNLALAFINKPKVVFLDEPTTGLDPSARRDFWNVLNELCNDTLLFLSSHYMEEVQKYCDKLVYLKNGKLLYAGEIDEFLKQQNSDNLSDVYLKISGGEDNVYVDRAAKG